MDRTTEKVACPLFLSPFSPSMFERSELRSRGEERMENGIGVRLCHHFDDWATFCRVDIIC
jgi:hypothetical protein